MILIATAQSNPSPIIQDLVVDAVAVAIIAALVYQTYLGIEGTRRVKNADFTDASIRLDRIKSLRMGLGPLLIIASSSLLVIGMFLPFVDLTSFVRGAGLGSGALGAEKISLATSFWQTITIAPQYFVQENQYRAELLVFVGLLFFFFITAYTFVSKTTNELLYRVRVFSCYLIVLAATWYTALFVQLVNDVNKVVAQHGTSIHLSIFSSLGSGFYLTAFSSVTLAALVTMHSDKVRIW